MSDGVEAGMAVSTVRRLGQRALSLGAANAFEFAVQFLLPVVLTRYLEPSAFGQYRLLWLAVGTVMAVAPLAMPASLYYFLPRSDGATKRLYVNQTMVFLALAGVVSGWAVSSWNPWLPEKLRGLAGHETIVPAFVVLWVVASLLDLLPAAEERVVWQAKATVGLAALRAAVLSMAAVLTRELGPVLLVLLGFVALKLALLLAYVARHHRLHGPILRWEAFADQVRYAAPLGAAGALYGLRVQADQWIVASLFSLGMFASFSIAALIGPLVHLFRQSVNFTFLPSMSRGQAAGDVLGMLELNSRANVMAASLLCPLLAFVFVFAEEIVTIVYTGAYVDAAPVMRVYIVGLAALVIELASVTFLLRQGPFVMGVNLVALGLSLPFNWFSAQHFGLTGAAVGSVIALYLDRLVTLRRVALLTGAPFRRLQDWRALGQLTLFSALAAAFAWGMVGRYFAASGPLIRVSVGAALLAVGYGTMHGLFAMGRGGFPAARNPEHGL